MRMLRGMFCALFVLLLLPGCVGTIALKPLPADHPANPEAPEAPVQAPPKTLREGPSTSADSPPLPAEHPADHEHTRGDGDQGESSGDEAESSTEVVYGCPMHPEVKESSPGHCPKCRMALTQEEGK